jgi:hypothetical protein
MNKFKVGICIDDSDRYGTLIEGELKKDKIYRLNFYNDPNHDYCKIPNNSKPFKADRFKIINSKLANILYKE